LAPENGAIQRLKERESEEPEKRRDRALRGDIRTLNRGLSRERGGRIGLEQKGNCGMRIKRKKGRNEVLTTTKNTTILSYDLKERGYAHSMGNERKRGPTAGEGLIQ